MTARGDPDAGAMFVKLCGRDRTATVLAQARRPDGTLGWLRATGTIPSGVMSKVTVRVWPGCNETRWKPFSSLIGRVTEL